MKSGRRAGALLAAALTILLLLAAACRRASASPPALALPDRSVHAFLKEVDAKRKELHVPGAAVAVVQNGKVVVLAGLGESNLRTHAEVTPDTLFAIGSCTKAFTSMLALMAVDDHKLKLSDPPHKFVPYFRLKDPDANRRITISDLLCHRSGLARTDLIWYSGTLSRKDVIRAMAYVTPTAKLGDRFQYQNVMYMVAGVCEAQAEATTWRSLLRSRILNPLGMYATDTSIASMERSGEGAQGYRYDDAAKRNLAMPARNLEVIAPAGAINSTARDMARWVAFLLNGGVANGKRIVSPTEFKLAFQPHMKVMPGIDYGYGWMLSRWRGNLEAEHGGNIDGYSADVGLLPGQRLGYVLLTNENETPLAGYVSAAVWHHFAAAPPEPTSGPPAEPASTMAAEAGVYKHPSGFQVEVRFAAGKLELLVAGQPNYPLENVGGRRYRLGSPAPDGFFVTFRPAAGDPAATEMYLQQPQGNLVLEKADKNAGPPPSTKPSAPYAGPNADLIGDYRSDSPPVTLTIAPRGDRVALIVPGQPDYPLTERGKDAFNLGSLPQTYSLTANRDEHGALESLTLKQPNITLHLTPVKPSGQPLISVDDLMAKELRAEGGEAAMRAVRTLKCRISVSMPNQGVQGTGVLYEEAPDSRSTTVLLTAVGKRIGAIHSYCDGSHAGEQGSFVPPTVLGGKELGDELSQDRMFADLDWKTTGYTGVKVLRKDIVDGEPVWVVEKSVKGADPITTFISSRTFLPVQEITLQRVPGLGAALAVTTRFKDYRRVDGVELPFEQDAVSPTVGSAQQIIVAAEANVPLPAGAFKPSAAAGAGASSAGGH